MNPTPSYGGNVCCAANTIPGNGGALDQRKMEERPDILVYTSEPLKEGMEVSGPITATLYVSSDVKDTDVTVKVIDVLPDGTAYNLDETIQRLRYREGDDHAVWMEKDKVYKVTLTPMNTSNYFDAGHRIRIEVAGSNHARGNVARRDGIVFALITNPAPIIEAVGRGRSGNLMLQRISIAEARLLTCMHAH